MFKCQTDLLRSHIEYTAGDVAKRTYHQYCALAQALDRIGERWTLLIIRQLLIGPRRFRDLLADLPGIGPNLLSARLRTLTRQGLIRRARLPPPDGSAVYELTEVGRGLEAAVVALAQWGRIFLGKARRGQTFRPDWALLAMKANFRPDAARGVRETYEYRIEGQTFNVRIDEGRLVTQLGTSDSADMILSSDAPTFLAVGTGQLDPQEAVRSGRMKVEGKAGALERSLRIFGVPPLAPRPRPAPASPRQR